MSDDLTVDAMDGLWTFRARVHLLPIEARAMAHGHMIGAPRMEYVRADLHRAAVEAAVRMALEATAEIVWDRSDTIRALASDPEAVARIVEGK